MSQLNNKIEEVLLKHFGHTSFRPHQREIIESTLSGAPTLAILPTGGGKSLTYQLPSFLLDGVSVIVSPLLSLIEDQVQSLNNASIKVARFDSTQTVEQKSQTLQLLSKGELQLLYTSPESLSNKEFINTLKHSSIGLIAIDEAHCIAEWGHSFRPSYLFLPKIVRSLKPKCILALTATATRKTASEIRKHFRIKTANQYEASNFRSNLIFQVSPCLPEHKKQILTDTLKQANRLPAIVYVMRQIDCESVAHHLQDHGFKARSYHAGMSPTSRKQIQTAFLEDEVDIIVATIAFGMGVDKPNIRTVIHYHISKSPEGWMQESGRAGRDGKESLCLTLACGDDFIPLENFIEAKQVRKSVLTKLLSSLSSENKTISFSPYHTRVNHDINTSTLDILLARLEISNKLKYKDNSWRFMRAWIVTGKTVDLSSYPKKLRLAIEHILHLQERYDTFNSYEQLGVLSDKLWDAMEQLHFQGDIVLIKKGWLWNYKIPSALNITELVDKLFASLTTQYATDKTKLNAVRKIATSKRCIPRSLAEWFGEKNLTNCGKCSSCLKLNSRQSLPQSSDATISDEELERMNQLCSHSNKFQTNQQFTRFLCGIPSPYLRHHRLIYEQEFGMLNHVPYDNVYAYAKAFLNASD